MPPATSTTRRPLRADARRNRDRLLQVAGEAFAEQGLDVGVAEIARRAEVGGATLFRHFATKDELIAAVIDRRVDEIAGMIEALAGVEDADAAFGHMMIEIVRSQVRDRALLAWLVDGRGALSQVRLEEHSARVATDVSAVLRRAQAAGAVRDDVTADDLLALTSGVASAHCAELDRPDLVERYLGVILDGLRTSQPNALHPGPVTEDQMAAARRHRLKSR